MRGQISPIFMVIILVIAVFALGIFGFVALMISDDFNTALQDDPDVANISKTTYSSLNDGMPNMVDGGILFLFVGVWIALMIGAYFIGEHPLIFFILLFVMVIMIVISATLSNTYTELASDDDFSPFTEQMPKTAFIMNHLVEFIIGIFLTIGIAMMVGRSRGY